MHIKYPAKNGYLSWDELGCLARAIGFPAGTFYNNLPKEHTNNKDGIKNEIFFEMMDRYEYFSMAMNQTFNAHSAEWNLNVIRKVIPLLHSKIITFAEVLHVRLAYQVYEEIDTRGMIINEHSVIRALKLCNRQISPLKMVNRLKHMSAHFEEEGRIQLHEFFDLLLWCQRYKDPEHKSLRSDRLGENGELFQLADFKSLLRHYDEELFAQLNDQYLQEEWKFSREKHVFKSMPKDVLPVSPEPRIQQVKYHRQRYMPLHREVRSSQRRVHTARSGYVRPRPLSAPDIPGRDTADGQLGDDQYKSMSGSQKSRPISVQELTKRFLQRPPTTSTNTRDEWKREFSPPPYEKYKRPKTPAVVTEEDMLETHNLIQTLKFKQQTMNAHHRMMLYEDLEALIPGITEKMEAFVPPDPPLPTPPPSETDDRDTPPSEETLKRLSTPNRRIPLPSHGRVCDARYRGWHQTQTVAGRHWILDSVDYEKSYQGNMYTKMREGVEAASRRRAYLVRYTTEQQARDDPMRPKAVQQGPGLQTAHKMKTRKKKVPTFHFTAFDVDQSLGSDTASMAREAGEEHELSEQHVTIPDTAQPHRGPTEREDGEESRLVLLQQITDMAQSQELLGSVQSSSALSENVTRYQRDFIRAKLDQYTSGRRTDARSSSASEVSHPELRKESLEQHNLMYERATPSSGSYREQQHRTGDVSSKSKSTADERRSAEDAPQVADTQPETTRTIGTTKSSSNSDKWTYISEEMEPLITQAPTWFGQVLKREFIPPGPRAPSARSYRRLSQSSGISSRLKKKLERKATTVCRQGVKPAETAHNGTLASLAV